MTHMAISLDEIGRYSHGAWHNLDFCLCRIPSATHKTNNEGVTPMGWGAEYIGVLLLTLGTALTLVGRKRRFDHTNRVGIEQFPSHWAKPSTNIKDGLLHFISLILLSAGLLILGFRFEDSWGWIVTLPAYAFMLFLLFGS